MSEILGVVLKTLMMLIGVAAVVMIGNAAIQNNKTSNAVSEISLLSTSVQAAVQSGTFSNVSVASVIAGDKGSTLAPSSMISGSSLINPWGGNVTINVGENASQFVITTDSVPNNGCAKLAAGIVARSITINGATQAALIDEPQARTVCTNGDNTLSFTFGH